MNRYAEASPRRRTEKVGAAPEDSWLPAQRTYYERLCACTRGVVATFREQVKSTVSFLREHVGGSTLFLVGGALCGFMVAWNLVRGSGEPDNGALS